MLLVLVRSMYTTRKRRGISGLMQVAMIVGIVIIFAGILFAFAADIFDVQTVAGSVSLQKVFVQQVGAESFLSVNIKNTGNSDITTIEARLMIDTDPDTAGIQPFVASITPVPLVPGVTGSAYERIVDTSGDAIQLRTGQEIAVAIDATTSDGSELTEPATVRVR